MSEINYGGVSSGSGHEDIAYGIFDRPGPSSDHTVPIVPSEMVATQMATERPPIDDPDYVPNTVRELATAVAEMTKAIPEDQIQKFYKTCQDLVEKTTAESELENEKEVEKMSETNLRKRVAAILREAVNKNPEWTKNIGDEEAPWWVQKQFNDEFESEEEEEIDEPEQEETSLKDIAAVTGFSGPSGVKNLLYRLQSQIQYFSNVPDNEFDALIEFAMGEYIDLLEQADLIDSNDAADMGQNKESVATLPSFKYFLYHALMFPAAKQIEKTSRDALKKQLDRMGLSPSVQGSVINQLTGGVPRNHGLIVNQLKDDVRTGKLKPQRAKELADEIANKFSALQSVARGGDDFAEMALQKYAKLNKSKLMSILKKSSQDPDVDAELAK